MADLFQVSVDEGKSLFEARKKAEKANVVPFGMKRAVPAEFRKQQMEGGEQVRKATLADLEKRMGSKKQALKEYMRMMGR